MNDNRNLFDVIADRSVLITGGTGSFGSAFVKAALRQSRAKKLILLSRDEQKHYQLQRRFSDRRLRFFVGDIRDRDRLRTAFRGVDVVVHAAAMKHVPICEYNPIEAVQTNINGAKNIIEMAIAAKVERVIALSTDKAVAPVNLYGATKLCMEKLMIAANAYAGDQRTRFSLVRYGNVMGSAGSVIPLFKAQRTKGQLTITDERMTRFWIDMEGAISLVLRGLSLMRGGEVFVAKLPTTDIVTLAEAVAPGVPRRVIGIRPGEKLHETLISADECRRTHDMGDVLVIRPELEAAPSQNEGRALPAGFSYSSDREELRLTLEQTRDMVRRVA